MISKTFLVLALLVLVAGCKEDTTTYHITCYGAISGTKLYEGEGSKVHRYGFAGGTVDLKFLDEDGQRVIVDHADCLVEENLPRHKP